jgi:FkbM family methyltransferase
MNRILGLVKYNRDWIKYVALRWAKYNHDVPCRFRLRNGQSLCMFADGRWVLNEIYLDRVYEIPGVDIRRCSTILDLGANVGTFALYVQSVSPLAHIYCFEPSGKNYDLLVQNLRANGVDGKAYQLAISGETGTSRLYTDGASVAYSLGLGSGQSEPVQTASLSRVFELTGVEHFDFVKMDVEGAELQILDSCTDDQLRAMSAISIEWHRSLDELQRTINRLRSIGFVVSGNTGPQAKYIKARLINNMVKKI